MTDDLAARRRAQERERSRRYRARHPERHYAATRRWQDQNPLARAAHFRVLRAVRSGRLVKPDRCEDCGVAGVDLHAHHDDYSRPLDVDWLCPPCHAVADGKTTEEAA